MAVLQNKGVIHGIQHDNNEGFLSLYKPNGTDLVFSGYTGSPRITSLDLSQEANEEIIANQLGEPDCLIFWGETFSLSLTVFPLANTVANALKVCYTPKFGGVANIRNMPIIEAGDFISTASDVTQQDVLNTGNSTSDWTGHKPAWVFRGAQRNATSTGRMSMTLTLWRSFNIVQPQEVTS